MLLVPFSNSISGINVWSCYDTSYPPDRGGLKSTIFPTLSTLKRSKILYSNASKSFFGVKRFAHVDLFFNKQQILIDSYGACIFFFAPSYAKDLTFFVSRSHAANNLLYSCTARNIETIITFSRISTYRLGKLDYVFSTIERLFNEDLANHICFSCKQFCDNIFTTNSSSWNREFERRVWAEFPSRISCCGESLAKLIFRSICCIATTIHRLAPSGYVLMVISKDDLSSLTSVSAINYYFLSELSKDFSVYFSWGKDAKPFRLNVQSGEIDCPFGHGLKESVYTGSYCSRIFPSDDSLITLWYPTATSEGHPYESMFSSVVDHNTSLHKDSNLCPSYIKSVDLDFSFFEV